MRINQYLAAATGLSRRAADAAIAGGRVLIDGQPVQLGQAVNPGSRVTLDGQAVRPGGTHSYVALNKPAGYVSSRTRQGNDPTLYELLPPEFHRLRIAGRLDRDSCGLILLSDDGDFVHRYTHPSFGKIKTYELTLTQDIPAQHLRQLEAGVELADGLSRVGIVRAGGAHITVSLSEGRNRQLRRTFGKLGYGVKTLQRIQMGPYKLGTLPPGKWEEIKAL